MTILVIDGMNFLHRARSGFQLGPHCVVFNFFRNLRALVEKFSPTRTYFVLEGKPVANLELLPEYKANRHVEPGTPEFEKMQDFWRQKDLILDLMVKHFPISVVKHPDFEADDTIYNLIERSSGTAEWVVASNDSDFTQLLTSQEVKDKNVRIYNPMKKEFVKKPDYCYVTWKALRGDPCDNIPGIISDGEATKIVNNPEALTDFFANTANRDTFIRNSQLIRFQKWTDEERVKMTSSVPSKDWDVVKAKFAEWDFKSLLKDKTWDKFIATFEPMWG